MTYHPDDEAALRKMEENLARGVERMNHETRIYGDGLWDDDPSLTAHSAESRAAKRRIKRTPVSSEAGVKEGMAGVLQTLDYLGSKGPSAVPGVLTEVAEASKALNATERAVVRDTAQGVVARAVGSREGAGSLMRQYLPAPTYGSDPISLDEDGQPILTRRLLADQPPNIEYRWGGDMAQASGINLPFGATGTLKSAWAIMMATHDVLLGMKNERVPTGFIFSEAARSASARLAVSLYDADLLGNDVTWAEVDEVLAREGIHIFDPIGFDHRDFVGSTINYIERHGLKRVVIDTYSRASTGYNENDATDTSAILAKLNAILDATGVDITLVHHEGYTPGRPRGSSSLLQGTDTAYGFAKGSRDDQYWLKMVKNKNGALRENAVGFRPRIIRGIKIGGEEHTGIALESSTNSSFKAEARPSEYIERLGTPSARAVHLLCRVLHDDGMGEIACSQAQIATAYSDAVVDAFEGTKYGGQVKPVNRDAMRRMLKSEAVARYIEVNDDGDYTLTYDGIKATKVDEMTFAFEHDNQKEEEETD